MAPSAGTPQPATRPGAGWRWLILTLGIAAASAAALEPGTHTIELEHEGRQRQALVHVPDGAGEPPWPVVLNFHGGGGHAANQQDYSRLHELGAREGFVTVYPDGTGGILGRLHTWNAGDCCGYAARENVDDVGFTAALIDRLIDILPADRARIYATGLSNGAMMTYRLAESLGDRLAAVAPVAGIVAPTTTNSNPVPILHLHSRDDPRALFDGGLGPPFPLTRTRVHHPPVTASLTAWAERNGCEPARAATDEASTWRGPDTEHRAVRLIYADCPAGATVQLWRLTGAGHVWPGATPALTRILGPATAVIDANAEIWAFFRDRRRTTDQATD